MRLLILAALLALPQPVLADKPQTPDPWLRQTLFGQVIRFAPVIAGSAGRAPDHAAQQGGNAIVEYIPTGETLQGWSQIHTLTAAQGLGAGNPDAASHAQAIGAHFLQGYRGACALDVTEVALIAPLIEGARATAASYLACDHVTGTGRGEAMVLLVIVGPRDTFTLQWAQRSAARPQPQTVDPAELQRRLDQLAQVHLCSPPPGEAPPYPSCA